MNEELNRSQGSFVAKHGQGAGWRLFVCIEAVRLGAPLTEGWEGLLFLGTAARLYRCLAAADAGTVNAGLLSTFLVADETHRVGSEGWKQMRQWRVALDLWETTTVSRSHVPRHGEDMTEADVSGLRTSYQTAQRRVVRRELLAYYFDSFEHQRDIEFAMRQAGMLHSCDAHGVGAYFGEVADDAAVRALFEDMSNVPGTMMLETFVRAVRIAYQAAGKAGHRDDLRKLGAVERAVAEQGDRMYISDYGQRLRYASDSGLAFVSPAEAPTDAEPSNATDDHALPLTVGETRVVIKSMVNNIQINQNALGIQVSDAEIARAKEAVDAASPSTLRRVLTEWAPQALLGASISLLFSILFVS